MQRHLDPTSTSPRLSRTASPARVSTDARGRSTSVISNGSRYDAVAIRLRAEEEMWATRVESAHNHREQVIARAKQIEDEGKRRARETLSGEMERSRNCISQNRKTFMIHVQRAHELQSMRHHHVELQAAARKRWEERLALENERRTNTAFSRHGIQLAERKLCVQEKLEKRFHQVQKRQSEIDLAIKQQHDQMRIAELRQVRTASVNLRDARETMHNRQLAEERRIQLALERAKSAERARVAAILKKEEADEQRTREALAARATQLDERRKQKAQRDEHIRKQKHAAEQTLAQRRASFEAHFDETVAVGTETREHNARVYRPPSHSRWF